MSDYWLGRTHYDVLEVERTASLAEIRSAYRLLSLVWHPDRFSDTRLRRIAEERTKRLNAAHGVLSNDERRRQYELTLPPADLDKPQFDDPAQNVPQIWKRMAAWMKDEDVGSGPLRSIAYTAGDYLERRRQLSDRQIEFALSAWERAVSEGFDPEDIG